MTAEACSIRTTRKTIEKKRESDFEYSNIEDVLSFLDIFLDGHSLVYIGEESVGFGQVKMSSTRNEHISLLSVREKGKKINPNRTSQCPTSLGSLAGLCSSILTFNTRSFSTSD